MKQLFIALLALASVSMKNESLSTNLYDYSFTSIDGKIIKMSDFKGKKLMIVNTASECGYTPQYEQLEKVYKQYKDQLVIIGFPTNDFGKQEPGSNTEIAKFCKSKYDVTFPMSEKITVKGDSTHPIYQWLTRRVLNGKVDSEIAWNFQKYIISESGQLIAVYPSKITPDDEKVLEVIKK